MDDAPSWRIQWYLNALGDPERMAKIPAGKKKRNEMDIRKP